MKILYLSMSFDKNRDSLYSNLVNALLEKKHDITIVRCDDSKNDIELISDNYRILNVKTLDPYKSNFILKGINQILLDSYFTKAIKNNLKNEKYDLILYATPPITLFKTISFCKKKYKAKTFLMLKDIFPQNAVDLGMFRKNGLFYKYFRYNEIKYYKISDYIGCMSKGNVDYILEHNEFISRNKVGMFPNSIKIRECVNNYDVKEYKKFIFGGNLGKPQYIEGFIKILDNLKNYPKAKFVICGDGTEKTKIINYLSRNDRNYNIEFYNMLPKHKYDEILASADIGFISLDPRFTIPNIPSKLQNYMMHKKPVFAFVDDCTDLSKIIDEAKCGWHCSSNDVDKACQLIKDICEESLCLDEKGNNGFSYLKENYDVNKNVEILEKFMEENKNDSI